MVMRTVGKQSRVRGLGVLEMAPREKMRSCVGQKYFEYFHRDK